MARIRRSLAFLLCWWMAAPLATVLVARGTARAADPAPRASTAAERQARGEEAARNFMQGRYDEALATFLDLYIQSDGRPEYLRNIGRCQQKLKQYPRAIESFKDYLRRAKHLGADERKEVQGFIAEMEAEMKTTAANGATAAVTAPAPAKAAPPATPPPAPAMTATPPTAAAPVFAPAPRPSPTPVPAPTPPTAYAPAPPAGSPPNPYAQQPPPPSYGQPTYGPAPPPSGPATAPNPALAENGGLAGTPPSLAAPAPAPAPPDLIAHGPEATAPTGHTSPLRIVGIVSLVAAAAGAVGGTVALLQARSTFNDARNAGCPGGNTKAYCNDKASAVDNSNTLSKILYIGAGVLGVAGITMVVAAPSATPEGRMGLAVSGHF